MPSSRKRLPALAAGLALVATGLTVATATSAQAASTGLVISEAYGGGGNSGATWTNDFIEIHNPTGAAISVDGWSVQWRSSGGTANATVTPISGSVPAGGHYLVQQAAGAGGSKALPTPDATGTIGMGGTSGTALLVNDTAAVNPGTGDFAGAATVVDLVGIASNVYENAATPTSLAAPGMSNTTSSSRTSPDADDNSAEFASGAPNPTNSEGEIEPPSVPSVDPVEASIPQIQGSGDESPLLGDPVITDGVVTAAYPAGGFFGFYMQTPGSGGAVDLETQTASDGLFVYYPFGSGNVEVEPGDHVEVTGEVSEYAGATQVTIADAATDVVELVEPATAPTPVTGVWPDTDEERELLEGMLFLADGEFTVSDTYSTNSFGEVGLARGSTPLVTPTEVADAQDPAAIAAVVADNAARGIILDDGSSTNYANSGSSNDYTPTNGHLTPPYVSNTEPVRVGAAATFDAPVVLTEGGSPSGPTYRFQPTSRVTGPANATSPVTFENTRTTAPDDGNINADGVSDVKVASFNVLNYFTTLGDANDDNVGDGGCLAYHDADGDGSNVRTGCDPRGAWDPQDLARQQEKIVAAINALDADVVGLMEIENSAVVDGVDNADEATATLVAALNAAAGSEIWAANPSSADLPAVGEMDVISNAIIYKVDAVERVGEARALGELSGSGEVFDNAREPIAQGFAPAEGGESLLVVVNHFKSKGSGTNDGTGQGNANPDRIAQAEALRDWVPGVQDALGIEATLLIGDFNSYSMEDPLQVLYAADYTNVEQASGNGEYSYSFGGQVGSLDHILANDAAMDSYTGIDVWNINSGESVALEYSRWNYHSTDFHTPTPYRSSDHDPVIMGLDLVDPVDPPDEAAVTTVTATGGEFGYGEDIVIPVDVDSANPTTGTVEIRDGDTVVGSTSVATDGTGTVTIEAGTLEFGTHTLTVRYSGDANNHPSTGSVEVSVVKVTPTMKVVKDKAHGKKGTTVRFTVELSARGQSVTGKVRVERKGSTWTEQLKNERAKFKLGPFEKAGTYRFTITYLGSDLVKTVTREVEITIRKPKNN